MSMTLRAKFAYTSAATLLSVAALAYTGYSAINETLKLVQLSTVNAAVRSQMELDMMHDAINGDVGAAANAVQTKNAKAIEALKESLKTHIETATKDIKDLTALELSPEVAAKVNQASPHFEAYGQQAAHALDIAAQDIAHGTNNFESTAADFDKTFHALEEELGDGGDAVVAWSEQIKSAGLEAAEAEQRNLLIVTVFAIAFAIFIPLYARRALFFPLNTLVDASNALAREEYQNEVPCTERGDEVGILAQSLAVLKEKAAAAFQLKRMVDEMPINIMTADPRNEFKINYANNASKTTLARLNQYLPVKGENIEGNSIDIFHKDPARVRQLLNNPANLPHDAKINVGPETLHLKVSAMFNKAGEYIGPMLTWAVITQSVKLANDFEGSVGAVSQQLGSSSIMLQERATSLHSAIEELSVAALEISKRVHDSLDIVRDAVKTGNNATDLTHQLESSAEKISNVVTLIRSIAEKTNLLALNASIESARAGDAGKGFAVVANEVKTLASQTANAIVEITRQIGEMQTAAKQTASAIAEMCSVVQNVNIISTTIASTVEEQQAATSEIARNISGTQYSEDPSMQASTIMGLAEQLTSVSGHLQHECDDFLSKVRNA